MGNSDKNIFESIFLVSNTMQYVTNKYTLKKETVVSVEMLVPTYQPTKALHAYSPPLAYRREAGQSTGTHCKGTAFNAWQRSELAPTGYLQLGVSVL
jgi:hypothetical protein